MSLFDQLGGNNAAQNQKQPNTQDALKQLRSDPRSFLQQSGLSIPDGMTDPRQIISHLMQSGQVPQSRYAQVLQMPRQGRR